MSGWKFKFGDTVTSAPAGSKAAFTGTVTFVGNSYYLVRDEDGSYWHRTASELSLVTDAPLIGATKS